jgi:hypothetical protein
VARVGEGAARVDGRDLKETWVDGGRVRGNIVRATKGPREKCHDAIWSPYQVTRCARPSSLEMSRADDDWMGDTRVSFELCAESDHTRVVLEHIGCDIHAEDAREPWSTRIRPGGPVILLRSESMPRRRDDAAADIFESSRPAAAASECCRASHAAGGATAKRTMKVALSSRGPQRGPSCGAAAPRAPYEREPRGRCRSTPHRRCHTASSLRTKAVPNPMQVQSRRRAAVGRVLFELTARPRGSSTRNPRAER